MYPSDSKSTESYEMDVDGLGVNAKIETHIRYPSRSADGKKFKTSKRKKSIKKKLAMMLKSDVEKKDCDLEEIASEIAHRKERAISYLNSWKNNKNEWKFEKLNQLWLFKNMFDETKVPENSFQILLEYLIDLKGASRNFATKLCENIISSQDNKTGNSHQRAKSVLQNLQYLKLMKGFLFLKE